MLFHHLGGDEDVIHIDEYKSCVNEILEEFIHHRLESCRRVGKTKEHHQGFKHSFVHLEGSFPFIAFLDSNIVVAPSYIKLSEDLCILQFIDDIRNERKWVLILDGDGVESSIVLYWMQFTILLLDKEEGRDKGGFGRVNVSVSSLEHVLQEHI